MENYTRNDKVFLGLFLVVAVILTSGCDTLNHQQFRIQNAANTNDIARVESVLHKVADEVGLHDETQDSKAVGTLKFYIEPGIEHFRLDIGARIYEKDILVDVMAGFGPVPPQYTKSKKLLISNLSYEFGPRLIILSSPVPIEFKEESNNSVNYQKLHQHRQGFSGNK